MSANGNDDGEEIPGREIAYRLFAAEYDDASLSYAESDEERAPNYVISPTGARLNRVFAVGTLTEVTSVNDEMVRARVVDPTGAFVVYAGQYQPDELATLEQLEPPAFVAVTGKARTFQPEDSDAVYTSLRPESIATVDADTRDRWVVSAAEQTVERVGTYAAAAESGARGDALTEALRDAGVDAGLAAGIPLAQDHYGTTPAYLAALRDTALEAVEVVAGEREQVETLSLSPGGSSPDADATFESLADLTDLALAELKSAVATEAEPETEPEPAAATPGTGSATGTATGTDRESSADVGVESTEADTAVDSEAEPPTESTPESAEPAAETTEATATGTGVTDGEADATADVADADLEPEPGSDDPTAEFDETTVDASDESGGEADDEELGDFDAGDSGMYEMDDEEREQLEEEFGAEFTTGGEVEEPGEADIGVPESEEQIESGGDDASDEIDDELGAPPESGLETEEPEVESESEVESAPEAESDEDEPSVDEEAETADESEPDETDAAEADTEEAEADEEPAEDVDLQEYVVETMEELDDGDGADRTELVERVADDTGVGEDEIEDAIQDALMGGQCYEPDDETLKAI